MRKSNRFITFFAILVLLFAPCALAKNENRKPPNFLKFIARSNEKYENPGLKEKLSHMKEMREAPESADGNDEFSKYDLTDYNGRNILESCLAWLAIICVCIIIIKIICTNFKIPFDYDPNFANKHAPRRKSRNIKYNFQKR